ncbi:hypothetical protein KM1_003080 [Entamoeba histolytica HM-3:IMSS]|uniref:Uncharacterized protein n=1 Tax=Entamoeba histolytica HM-3:IMSS TaxID=885315 RepID=M7WSR2_ENTHI|nr:hypothetical protein KM1_003080 [Entamoeba histolytica HM-3:IMSS]
MINANIPKRIIINGFVLSAIFPENGEKNETHPVPIDIIAANSNDDPP